MTRRRKRCPVHRQVELGKLGGCIACEDHHRRIELERELISLRNAVKASGRAILEWAKIVGAELP